MSLQVTTRNTRSVVYENLRGQIARLELPPGTPLSENELAGRLGVSRTPVRESLILLADEGLVTVRPQVGTFVAPIRAASITEAQFIRESLECAALVETVPRIDEAGIAQLWRLIAAQEAADRAGDSSEFFTLDESFHATLMEFSGHAGVWRTVNRAKTQLDRARHLSLSQPHKLDELIAQHRAIVDGVAARDTTAATAALRNHLRQVLSDIEQITAENPDLIAEG